VGEVIDPSDQSVGGELIRKLLDGPAAAWLAQSDQLALLELIRDAWNERAVLMADIKEHGYGGERYTRSTVARLDRVERNLTIWLSLSGLTPVDRSRLGVAEVKVRSRLEGLRDRRADRSRAG